MSSDRAGVNDVQSFLIMCEREFYGVLNIIIFDDDTQFNIYLGFLTHTLSRLGYIEALTNHQDTFNHKIGSI